MNLNTPFRYSDKALWVLFYPIIACSFLFIANDNPFKQLIQLPSFSTDLLFALAITYLVGIYIKWITLRLDQAIPRIQFKERIKQQLIKGIVVPLAAAMLLEIIYLQLIDIPLRKSAILNLELPLAFLFLLLVNGFYLGTYLFYNKKTEIITVYEKEQPGIEPLKYIAVQEGYREQKIDIKHCAYIKSSQKILWLYTHTGNYFRLNGTLDEWEQKLAPEFFKINRQYIVAPDAIKSIEQTETRKLKVHFNQAQDEEIFISKVNALRFRNWWKKDCPL